MKTRNIKEVIRYSLLWAFPQYFTAKVEEEEVRRSNIVVTMTTLPSRIGNIQPTIASLCNQTVLPEKILINIPEYSKREKTGYRIPDFLKENPLVEINFTEEDLGPATKLLPALEKYWDNKDQLLMVVDDDEVYPKGLIENYLQYTDLSENAVLTLVGWNAPEDFIHAHRTVVYGAIGSKPENSEKVEHPTRVDCVQGASSFLVRPRFFDITVFNYSLAPKEAFFVDDIYISGHLARQLTPIYVVPAPFRYARMKVTAHLLYSENLHRKENKSGHNNNKLYRFYKDFWFSMNKYQPSGS